MTRKSMREYAMFIRSTLEYADENYGVKNPIHKIPALGSRSRSVDTIKKHQIKQLQDTLKESSMLEQESFCPCSIPVCAVANWLD